MKFFWKKSSAVKWVILSVPITTVLRSILSVISWQVIVKWALRLAILTLRSTFVSFTLQVPKLLELVADKVKDGSLSDDDLADILDYIKHEIGD